MMMTKTERNESFRGCIIKQDRLYELLATTS